uniref:Co-chaperone DjlA n=1 Tax=Candidatus Aschnera chinzeii TaxID=1485666 RepID=A0AAT9G3S7_9ENTR|nr:MAG: co-chaperone DjlA [Candidatus Aschnera chinzeii]
MSYIGKIIGIILGIMSGAHIYGVIIGFILGHVYDKFIKQERLSKSTETQYYPIFFCISTFQILGHLVKSKGRVTEFDIQFANNMIKEMGLYGNSKILVQSAFMDGKNQYFLIRKVLKNIQRIYYNRLDLIQLFLEIQIRAAFNDGVLHPNEENILFIIREELKIPIYQFKTLLLAMEMEYKKYSYDKCFNNDEYNSKSLTLMNAYKILGVDANETLINIKRAYRKLMSKNHPDKLISQQLSSKTREEKKKYAQLIQVAYDIIKKHHTSK